jgi:hypothetical protein
MPLLNSGAKKTCGFNTNANALNIEIDGNSISDQNLVSGEREVLKYYV